MVPILLIYPYFIVLRSWWNPNPSRFRKLYPFYKHKQILLKFGLNQKNETPSLLLIKSRICFHETSYVFFLREDSELRRFCGKTRPLETFFFFFEERPLETWKIRLVIYNLINSFIYFINGRMLILIQNNRPYNDDKHMSPRSMSPEYHFLCSNFRSKVLISWFNIQDINENQRKLLFAFQFSTLHWTDH